MQRHRTAGVKTKRDQKETEKRRPTCKHRLLLTRSHRNYSISIAVDGTWSAQIDLTVKRKSYDTTLLWHRVLLAGKSLREAKCISS